MASVPNVFLYNVCSVRSPKTADYVLTSVLILIAIITFVIPVRKKINTKLEKKLLTVNLFLAVFVKLILIVSC